MVDDQLEQQIDANLNTGLIDNIKKLIAQDASIGPMLISETALKCTAHVHNH